MDSWATQGIIENLSKDTESTDKLDIWLLNLTRKLKSDIDNSIKSLELFRIPEHIMRYVDMLANVWVKFSRDRLKNNYTKEDTVNSVSTLYKVLLESNLIISPFMPFNSDLLHNIITNSLNEIKIYESIHVKIQNKNSNINEQILESVENVITIIELVRSARTNMNKPLTMPIRNMEVYLPEKYVDKIDRYFDRYILEQGNIENITYNYSNENCVVIPERGALGKKFRKDAKKVMDLISKNNYQDLDILVT